MSGFTPEQLASVGYKTKSADFTQEQLASVGYKPKAADASFSDKLMSGAAGFLGEASDLVGTGLHNTGKLIGSQGLQDFAQPTIDYGQKLTQRANEVSLGAAGVGKVGADVLGALAVPGSGLAGMAGAGAAVGLATSKGETAGDISMDALKSAALSFGIGSVIKAGTSLIKAGATKLEGPISTIAKNFSTLKMSPDDFAQTALDATLKKSGDLSKATAEDVVNAISSTTRGIKDNSNALYAARDAIAEHSNVTVGKDSVKHILDDLTSSIRGGATSETKAALNSVRSIYGSGAPVSFSKAQSLVSDIGSSINTATRQGDMAKAFELGKVKDALVQDIDNASGMSSELRTATNTANAYYKSVYRPVRDLKVQDAIAGKVTNDIFVSKLLKGMSKSPAVAGAVNNLGSETKLAIVGAHQNALANSLIEGTGQLNLQKYANALDKDIQANKELYKGTNTLTDLSTLANVLSGASMAGKASIAPLAESAAISTGFAALTGTALAGAGYMVAKTIPQAKFLYGAGKMLSNESSKALLSSMRDLSAYPESSMFKMTSNKVNKLFNNQFSQKASKAALLLGLGSSN